MAVDNFHNFISNQRNWSAFLTLVDAADGLSQLQPGVRVYIITEDRFYYWKNSTVGFVPEDQSVGADDQTAAQVPYNNIASGLIGTDVQAALDELAATAGGGAQKKTWSWRAGRNNVNTSQVYLRAGTVPTNLTPFIAPYPCTITNITAATRGVATWTAEVRVDAGLGFITQGTLAITGVDKNTSVLNIPLNTGDKVGLYCNGLNINRPTIDVIVKEI